MVTQSELTAAPEDIKMLYDINLEVLGERLRRARIERKISQRDLSSGLFTSAYLSSLELGKTRPTYKTLVKLAERLGKSLDYFLRQTSGMSNELDEEQARILEVRLALLTAQTALEKTADEKAENALEHVKLHLARLTNSERARFYYLRGRFFLLKDHTSEALVELDEARRYLQEGADIELEVLLEMAQGAANYQQRRIMPAITHYLAALELVNRSKDGQAQVLGWKIQVNIGNCYLLLNDWQHASTAFQEALERASGVADPQAQASLHYSLAAAYGEQGDFQRACLNLGRCLQIYEGVENQSMLLRTHNALAQIFAQYDQYDRAEAQVNDALRLARVTDTTDRCQEMNALVTLALVNQKQQKLTEAQGFIDQALELLGECDDRFHQGRLYRIAAEVKADSEDRDAARSYYNQALTVLEGTGLANSLADVYHSYGQRLRTWGEIDEAFKYMERAYQERERGRSNRNEGDRA